MKTILCLAVLFVPIGRAAQEKDPSARDLLKEALTKAKEGKKAVLLNFGSPG